MVAVSTSRIGQGAGKTAEGMQEGFQAAFLGASVVAGIAALAALILVRSTGPKRDIPVG
jgi:hypothetical protein